MLDREESAKCVRCGLCLNACPTFRLLGEEMDSPRGRIYQLARAADGQLELAGEVALHLDRCLGCRACETACPSGVRYGRILESARAEMHDRGRGGWGQRLLLRSLVPRPARRRAAAAALRLAQATGLDRLGGRAAQLAPRLERRPFREQGVFAAEGPRRARVVFLPGCVQCELVPELNHATLRVLRAQGCEVEIPPAFACCGALHQHAGDHGFAQRLADENLQRLAPIAADAVVTNAAGCGARLKEYLPRTRDFSEFLDQLGLRTERLGPVPAVASYQDACHLAHAQRVREAPRRLLRAIPGLELREMHNSDQCCGSAGDYNLRQPDIARALLAARLEDFRATGASLLATANPGCSLQWATALGPDAVQHIAELLDAAHRAATAANH